MRGEKAKECALHKIRETPLEEIDLENEYEVCRSLAEGCFAKVLLAKHRRTNTTVVLKAIHTELTAPNDFYREFHYSYHLSPHPNILSCYAVAFRALDCFVFAQEYASYGDLADRVKAGGLPEIQCKRVTQQLSSALDFLHSKDLVHRDLKLENVLVFALDLSKIKLCDFGATRREGCLVSKTKCTWHPFLPPEVVAVLTNERYHCHLASDCWQLGIILFVCLTGCPPWQSADPISDTGYGSFVRWIKRKTTKIPPQFRRFTPRLLRLFRRVFEHKPEHRPSVTEFSKYLKDTWLLGGGGPTGNLDVHGGSSGGRRDSLCTYLHEKNENGSHFGDESKIKLKKFLSNYGLETTVDHHMRVLEWVLACDSERELQH